MGFRSNGPMGSLPHRFQVNGMWFAVPSRAQ